MVQQVQLVKVTQAATVKTDKRMAVAEVEEVQARQVVSGVAREVMVVMG